MITPHGGQLINRLVDEKEKNLWLSRAKQVKSIELSAWTLSDLELIGTGAFSPLIGFMDQQNYQSVLTKMRLANGLVWSLPITLPVSISEADMLQIDDEIALKDNSGNIYGVLNLQEKYKYNKEVEARAVFGTTDPNHPGVKKIHEKGDIYLAGPIKLIQRQKQAYKDYYMDPNETRELFRLLGWNSIVGFQTRNPIHRAHEYLHKVALELVDGLLLHPLIGETKQDDISANVRMNSYKVLLDNYYPKNRVKLAVFPAAMRYAGPREALFHALVRKNYGCTHFIIGRDHAGVGDYYGTYDAQKIFDSFSSDEIGITIFKFEHAFFCYICKQMATKKSCPHDNKHHLHLSGTKVREMLRKGKKLPAEFSRPEVIKILMEGLSS